MLYPCFASAQVFKAYNRWGRVHSYVGVWYVVQQKRKDWSSELLRSRPVGLLP